MATLAPIKIVISGIDRFSNKMSKIQKSVKKMSAGMTKTGSAMTAGVTVPVLGASAAIFKAGYQFDKFMNMVEAKSKVSGKSMEDLRAQALKLGSTTSFSHIQAAEGMNYLAQAGWDTGQVFEAILPTLNLAQATNIELGQSADWLSNIMGGMKIPASQAADSAAVLARATAAANVSMEDLSYTFADAGPIAAEYGVTLREMAAATGFLGNVGIKGTKAGTALKNMMLNLAAPTKEMADKIKALGLNVETKAGKLVNFTDVLRQMSTILPKLTQRDQLQALDTIFGKRAIAGAAALTSNLSGTTGELEALLKTLEGVKPDGLEEMVKIMRKGSVGAWDDTISALQGLGQAIGDSGLMVFVTKGLIKLTGFFRLIAEKSPALLWLGTIIALVAAAVGPLLVALGMALPVIAAIGAKIAAAGGAMALLSNPIGWVILGIIALTAVVIALWDELKPLREMIGNYLARGLTILTPLWEALKRTFLALWEVIKQVVLAFQPLIEILFGAFGSTQLTGLEIFVSLLIMVLDVVTKIVGWFAKLIGFVGDLTKGLRDMLKPLGEIGNSSLMKLGGLASGAANWFSDKLGYGNKEKLGLGGPMAAAQVNVNQGRDFGNGQMIFDFRNVPKGMIVTQEGQTGKVKTDNGSILNWGF